MDPQVEAQTASAASGPALAARMASPAEAGSSQPPAADRRLIPARRTDLLIFLLAMMVRLVYLWQLRGSPVYGLIIGDAESYDAWARRLAAGDWVGGEVFYQAPLYPYFLAVLYAVGGASILWVRLVQMTLGAVACVFLARAGRCFFSGPIGVLAGVLLALHPTAFFLEGMMNKSVLDTFFITLLLWLAGIVTTQFRGAAAPRATPDALLWAAVGLTLGCLILTRENCLVLAAVIALWLLLRGRGAGVRRQALRAGGLAGGLTLMLMPVMLRNYAVGGEFHLTTSQLGPNLYIGNNPRSVGTHMPLRPGRGNPAYERRDATDLAEAALGRRLTPGEVSQYWLGRTLAYIRAQPGHWLWLLGRKLALFWNSVELSDTEDQATYGDYASVLRVLSRVLHMGVVAPLALLGAALTWRQRRELGVLYLLILAYAASIILFFIFARYRFPVVPMLLLFAAAGLVRLVQEARQHRWGLLATGLTLGLCGAVLANWPIARSEMQATRAVMLNNIGVWL